MRALFVSTEGTPATRTRLIAGLHYLKRLHDLSDEQVVKSWTENPYWQYFCGEEYFQHRMPLHPTPYTQKWPPKIGQRDKCLLGSSRHLGSRFVVDAVRRAPVKRLVPSLGIVEGEIPAQ